MSYQILDFSVIIDTELNMGAQSPKSTPYDQQQAIQKLQQRYFFKSNNLLLHKQTNQFCTLYKINAYTKEQCLEIKRAIKIYNRSSCPSIMQLKQYYRINKDSYCSNEQSYYMVFEGNPDENLRNQLMRRQKLHIRFTENEIKNIISCVLCGLKEYFQSFKRSDIDLQLQSILIDKDTQRLSLEDLWISKCMAEAINKSRADFGPLSSYPSPQKIHTSHNVLGYYDQNLSLLFSAGALGFALLDNHGTKNNLYNSKYSINQFSMHQKLSEIRDPQIKTGLRILLSENPENRKLIYQYWNINSSDKYYLNSPLSASVFKQSIIRMFPQPPKQQIIFNSNTLTNSVARVPLINPYPINIIQQSSVFNKSIDKNSLDAPRKISPQFRSIETNNTLNKFPTLNRQKMENNMLKLSKVSFTFNNQNGLPSTNYSNNFNDFLGIKATQSRIKPVSVVMSPSYSQKRYSSNDEKPHRVVSPIKINSPELRGKDRSPMTTSLHLDSIPYISQSSPDNLNIKLIHTDRTNTSQPRQDRKTFNEPITNANSFQYENIVGQQNKNRCSPNIHTRNESFERNNTQYQRIQLEGSSNFKKFSLRQNQPQFSQNNTLSPQKKAILSPDSSENAIKANTEAHSSSFNNFNNQQTIIKTPEVRKRIQNRYNSTIVEVNEETPNSSEKSLSNAGEPQYVAQEYDTGSKFQGYMKNGQKNGRGKFYFFDGGVYDGVWKNDQMHGWGKLYYQQGKLAYEGNWSNGEFDGYGKVYNDNPVKLNGNYDYSNFDNLGEYWQEYEGMFSRDTKEGRGRIFLTNGQIFEGDFHNDRIQGFGKFLRKDGMVIEGIWKDSQLLKILNH